MTAPSRWLAAVVLCLAVAACQRSPAERVADLDHEIAAVEDQLRTHEAEILRRRADQVANRHELGGHPEALRAIEVVQAGSARPLEDADRAAIDGYQRNLAALRARRANLMTEASR